MTREEIINSILDLSDSQLENLYQLHLEKTRNQCAVDIANDVRFDRRSNKIQIIKNFKNSLGFPIDLRAAKEAIELAYDTAKEIKKFYYIEEPENDY